MAETLPTSVESSTTLETTEEASSELITSEGIKAYLKERKFSFCPQVKTVERLPEGHGGFVYRVQTSKADAPSVIVKHAEGYAARAPSWKLDTSRMV